MLELDTNASTSTNIDLLNLFLNLNVKINIFIIFLEKVVNTLCFHFSCVASWEACLFLIVLLLVLFIQKDSKLQEKLHFHLMS